MLGQLRNICSALCIAGSPWEQGATSDEKSQEILKTTDLLDAAFLSNILAAFPGSRNCLQHPSTPTQTTVLWHWALQNSYPTAWSWCVSLVQYIRILVCWNFGIKYRSWNTSKEGREGPRSFCSQLHGAPNIMSPACRSGHATAERIRQKQKIPREGEQGLSEEWEGSQ